MLVVLTMTTSAGLAEERLSVEDADGRLHSSLTLQSWTPKIVECRGETLYSWSPGDLQRITFSVPAPEAVETGPLVILASGDRIAARPVGIFEDVLTATWSRFAGRPPLKIPLETVTAVLLDLPAARDEQQKLYSLLQTLPAGQDFVLLTNGDRVQGELERLDATFVQIRTPAGLLKLDRSRVLGIRMNPELVTTPAAPPGRLAMFLRDGSQLTAESVELSGRDLRVATTSRLELALSPSDLARCQFFGDRVVPLTDRQPQQTEFVPFLSHLWPVVRNANVLRGPLSLRGTTHAIGLGVHSKTRVTYALEPGDHEFRATVGIDDCAGGQGSVRFAVELDGRRTWESPELTGHSQPVSLPPVPLAGARTLSLVVEFGARADLSDYADWCDTVILRKP